MSHFAVAVFSDDGNFDRLLEPYNEADEKYFVFNPVAYEHILEKFDKFRQENHNWTLDMYINEMGYQQVDGQWGYYDNPNGYWDWYSLDGKDYLFEVKDDCKTDPESEDWIGYFRKNDYEWYPDDREAKEDAEEFWDDFIGDTAIAQPPGIWNKQYFLDRYKTKKQYVKEMSRTIPYAFITPDGVWHSAGRVGWFAISDETAEDSDRYMKEWDAWLASEANPYVSLVDCHI